MKRAAVVVALVLLLVCPAVAQQGAPAGAPAISRYILVEVDRVNPAKSETYNKVLKQFRENLNAGKSESYWIAMTPITGQVGSVGYVSFLNSMAAVDNMLAEFEKTARDIALKDPSFTLNMGESVLGAEFELMEFKPELSLRPGFVPGPEATRYLTKNVVVKPGMAARYGELIRDAIGLQKDVPNAHWITYVSLASSQGTLFTFVTPLRSLADLDEDQSAVMNRLLTPLLRRDFDQRTAACVESVKSGFFMVQPQMSRVPPSFAAANASYWTIKEEPVVAAAKGKKKSTVVPAALEKPEKK